MAKNIAEFRIIGQIGKIDEKEKVTFVDVCANYNRKDGDEWKTDAHWNRVTCFTPITDWVKKAKKGELVHITGRVRQGSFEKDGQTVYTVELIADTFSVLAAKDAEGSED